MYFMHTEQCDCVDVHDGMQWHFAGDGTRTHGKRRTQLFALRSEDVRETAALHKDTSPY